MYKFISRICAFSVLLHGCKLVSCFFDLEELQSVKYGVEITKKPVIFSQEPLSDNILHLSSKYGQMYQCVIPKWKDENKIQNETNKTAESNATVASVLNNTLHGECLFYTQGWWTYKFCYGNEITQFHEAENGIIQGDVISLGVFESEKQWNETDSKSKSNSNLYHTQNYTNGSNCDLTGMPRRTLVKFFCNEEVTNSVVSLEEPATCVYTITVHSKELCKHPLFTPPKKVKPKEITCSPALTKDQYDQFMKKEEDMLQRKKEEEIRKLKEESEISEQNNDRNKKVKGLPDLMKGLLSVGKMFDAIASSVEKKSLNKEDEPADKLEDRMEDLEKSTQTEEPHRMKQKGEDGNFDKETESDIYVKEEKPETEQDQPERNPSNADTQEVKPEATNVETEELFSDNKMSKGENMASSEGRFIERNGEKFIVKPDSPEVKNILSLQKKLKEIDEKAEFLRKQDRRMRGVLEKQYVRTRKKALDQIKSFKKLLQKLVDKKAKVKFQKSANALDLLIEKVTKNIKTYKKKIRDLDAKMKAALEISENVDKRYENLFGTTAANTEKSSLNTGNSEKITQILKDVFKNAAKKPGTDRIAISGDQLHLDEATENAADIDSEEEITDKEPQKDKVLDAVIKLMQMQNKKKNEENKQKDETNTAQNSKNSQERLDNSEKTDSEEGENIDKAQSKDGFAKVKVRVSKLEGNDVKVLEEEEKQQELEGTASSANRLKSAGKKIEKMIKDKLKKAGVDVGANIKIKIITNDAQMSKMGEEGESTLLNQDTATQFKDMLVNLLGGGEEKVKEERRHATLEDNYKFVYNQDGNNEQVERTEEQNDNQIPLL